MAIATPRQASEALTYEQYMAEGEIKGRYSIVDGVRTFMAGASWRHQRIAGKISRALLAYEEQTGIGMALSAPFDVMIRRQPLRTRQPDVLFITRAQLDRGGGIPDRGALEVAPELVVEIISDSETERILGDKLADYGAIGVKEAWLFRCASNIVDVVRLSLSDPAQVVAMYDETQTLQSFTFPDLSINIADLFR